MLERERINTYTVAAISLTILYNLSWDESCEAMVVTGSAMLGIVPVFTRYHSYSTVYKWQPAASCGSQPQWPRAIPTEGILPTHSNPTELVGPQMSWSHRGSSSWQWQLRNSAAAGTQGSVSKPHMPSSCSPYTKWWSKDLRQSLKKNTTFYCGPVPVIISCL